MIKLKEAIHVQKPANQMKKDPGTPGYLSKSETDPSTGTSITYLENEPELLQIARLLDKSIKELKYYQAIPDTSDEYAAIKVQAGSIITSLRNAVGKLRDLDRIFKGLDKMKKKL